jgi:transcription elongation GreA/GreB family factor
MRVAVSIVSLLKSSVLFAREFRTLHEVKRSLASQQLEDAGKLGDGTENTDDIFESEARTGHCYPSLRSLGPNV